VAPVVVKGCAVGLIDTLICPDTPHRPLSLRHLKYKNRKLIGDFRFGSMSLERGYFKLINDKRVLGLIPARGGSKRLPRKNLLDLNGKPLIVWTIESALNSKLLDDVIVSTDDLEISSMASLHGIKVPFIRPADLARDDTPSIDVVLHAIDEMKTGYGLEYDYICLLEPTSPIRKNSDIDAMIAKLESKAADFDGIISVGEALLHPSIMQKVDDDNLRHLFPQFPITTIRQEYEAVHVPFGVAYICKTDTLISEKTFYPTRLTHYTVERYQYFEVDDYVDLLCIEAVLRMLGKDN